MPAAPDPITSPPPVPGQPYDSAGEGAVGKWQKVKEAGAADSEGNISGGWPGNGASGSGGWEQV